MIPYDDPTWGTLYGGYRVLYDPSPALRALESGSRPRKEVWDEFWQELHHQGDVDTASYAVVPELARIVSAMAISDWQPFAIAATVEDCRRNPGNPELPPWIAKSYTTAIQSLARFGCSLADRPWSHEQAQSILSLVAFANGLPSYGKLLIDFTDDELKEMIDDYIGR